jgi:hypothetical protein
LPQPSSIERDDISPETLRYLPLLLHSPLLSEQTDVSDAIQKAYPPALVR